MLPGMNQTLVQLGEMVDRFDDGCGLHEIWTRTDNVHYFHFRIMRLGFETS
jgi:hypothetical protein